MKPNKSDFIGTPFISRGDPPAGARAMIKATAAPVTAIERRLMRRLMGVLGAPPIEVIFWDGQGVAPAAPAEATMIIRNRKALWRLLVHPVLHFGEEYAAGNIEVEGGLVRFMEAVNRARQATMSAGLTDRIYLPRRNTLSRAHSNVHHHYDIGNDFYRLWLDREMVYTCAYFPQPSATLEAAQFAKMEHVCRKLALQPGARVVEAGCGWGALARHMARYHGARVKAYNISHQQIAFATERAKAEGLSDRIEFIEDDYRNIHGEFDVFVSVGMLEHVGPNHYRQLGAVIDRTLKDNGRGLVHTIGQNQPRALSAWLLKYIFPGAYPPTLRQAMAIFEPYGFAIRDVENLRSHYAKTLEHWLARFEDHSQETREMFDEWFERTWRLYLCGSLASFTTGSLQLFQILFARPGATNLPWTRAYLYNEPREAEHGARL